MENKKGRRKQGGTSIIKHELKEVEVFEVLGRDLDKLATKSTEETLLSFSLSLLSFAGAILISLFTSTYRQNSKQYFVSAMTICTILGLVFIFCWYRKRNWRKEMVNNIKMQTS